MLKLLLAFQDVYTSCLSFYGLAADQQKGRFIGYNRISFFTEASPTIIHFQYKVVIFFNVLSSIQHKE